MTDAEKMKIIELRGRGDGYGGIASELGLSLYAVRRFCRKLNLNGSGDAVKMNYAENKHTVCLACGLPLPVSDGQGRKRKFCSSKCRNRWWRYHPEKTSVELAVVTQNCIRCGEAFISYRSNNRKYCSHKCYIEHRFGGKNND